jgi:hypothetical protein
MMLLLLVCGSSVGGVVVVGTGIVEFSVLWIIFD